MNLLLLPGRNIRNMTWLPKVEQAMAPLFTASRRFDLAHWDNGGEEIELEVEKQKLASEVIGLEPYVVFAKSAGSVIACLAMSDESLAPKACLFAGFPLAMVQRFDLPLHNWLHGVACPIHIVQNDHDPLGGFEAVQRYFQDVGSTNVTIHRHRGETHDYEDFEGLKSRMVAVLSQT